MEEREKSISARLRRLDFEVSVMRASMAAQLDTAFEMLNEQEQKIERLEKAMRALLKALKEIE